MSRPVLITLTAPSCSGKSYLLNYIRDEAKLPCLVSTTTRAPRAGEREGIDYYFISDELSKQYEIEDNFAELAIYNNNRYGVTKEEFRNKLDFGLAFLIVEPLGIHEYAKPAKDAGASHVTVFVDTPYDKILSRFIKRFTADLQAISSDIPIDIDKLSKCVAANTSRYTAMAKEKTWKSLQDWDLIINGEDDPATNLQTILTYIKDIG